MNQQYVPLDKRTKRKRKEHHNMNRRDWGGINPVTKVKPNDKIYNRKRKGQWSEYEPLSFYIAYPSDPGK